MGFILCLIALGLGYRVLLDASKEKEALKYLGQLIGIVMIIGSLMGLVCSTLKYSGHCSYKPASGMFCPMTAKPS